MTCRNDSFGENGFATLTDDTPTVLAFNTPPAKSAGCINMHVMLRRVSDGASKCMMFETAYKVDDDGTLSIIGGQQIFEEYGTSADIAALQGCTAALNVSGPDLQVIATSLDEDEIDWSCMTLGKYVAHVDPE